MSVTYRLIGVDGLDHALVSAWRSIRAKDEAFVSPFFCPEFTQAVGRVRDDVRIVVIEDAGRPVGFFPHQRSFFGKGKPVGGPLSDYHGVIAEPGSEWEVEALVRTANLSVWTFDHLVGDVQKFQSYVKARATSPQIKIGAGYQQNTQARREVQAGYIKEFNGLARQERKLAREFGELRFTFHEMASEPIERLLAWKSEQYRRSGGIDVFGVPWTRNLVQVIANIQTSEFAGVCSVLRVGDRIVAVHMGLRSRDVLHYWFPAYDREFAKFSTGMILLKRMTEAPEGIGIRTIDLGKGESWYKQKLMNGAVELRMGAVEVPSLLASARQLHRFVEERSAKGGLAAMLKLPLKTIRRIERTLKFR